MMKVIVAIACVLSFTNSAVGLSVEGDRTMTVVVKKLQDMMKASQEDGAKDRDLYAKFKCYCDNNEVNKRENIRELKKEILLLSADIDQVQAVSGELSTECAELQANIADNERAVEDAESLREKELKHFTAEEEDMVSAIDSMDNAIKTLAAVGGDQTALVSTDKFMSKSSLLKIGAQVKVALGAISVLLTNKERRSMDSFIQAPFTGEYTSQSGEIVGILKNMRDTFKSNLASARSAEKNAAKAHESFMKIKKAEHATMTKAFDEKQSMLGENDDKLASLRESLETAQHELAEDEEFLAKLLAMCATKAKEYGERQLLRANEEAAISEAISILNSDEAFAAFGKTKATKSGGTEFLQISQHSQHLSARDEALQQLKKAAHTQKSLKLARIVVLLEAENPFATVLDEIAKMIKIIDEEEKADKDQKEWCTSEREESHQTKMDTEDAIESLENEITSLKDEIHNPETGLLVTIAGTEADLATNHDDQVTETGQRAKENRLYQTNIKNIVTCQKLIKKALKVLKKFYAQFEEESFAQSEPEDVPETMEDAGQKGAGAKVLKMLGFIVEESHAEEIEAHSTEEGAQHAFEDSMAELKSQQASLEEQLADLKVELAEKEKLLGEKEEDLGVEKANLKAVKKYLLKIKPGCDFIEENFDARNKGREAEKGALEKATEMLKDTPAYKAAVRKQEVEDLGECKDICLKDGEEQATCKACLAGTSVPGYCAGHKDTPGC